MMLFSSVVTALLLSGWSSVSAAPLFERYAAAAAPAGTLRQTSRDEIMRRSNRPARRAHVSPALPPANFGPYINLGIGDGRRPLETPATGTTISATLAQNEVITQCMGTVSHPPTEEVYIWYSNSQDIWHCDLYTVRPVSIGGLQDSDVEFITAYRYTPV